MTVVTSATELSVQTFEIVKEETIAAPVEIVFETMVEHFGPSFEPAEGMSLHMKLEAWPGGRWFRDLGNNTGHLWAHVQVIKPPKLIEFCGPLMMSFPAINHVQYRLTEDGNRTKVTLIHRGFGEIPAEHREGMNKGWQHKLERV